MTTSPLLIRPSTAMDLSAIAAIYARAVTHSAASFAIEAPDLEMIAVIGDATNAASISVHRTLGFREAGLPRAAGRKFDRWIDLLLMQRSLGAGDSLAPAG